MEGLPYQLFIENNSLRAQLDTLEKSFHAKCNHIDEIEDELWHLKDKAAQGISTAVSNIHVKYKYKGSYTGINTGEAKSGAATVINSLNSLPNSPSLKDLNRTIHCTET